MNNINTLNVNAIAELKKALEAGSGADPASFASGRALVPESLDRQLRNIIYKKTDMPFYMNLKKNTVMNTTHQRILQTDFGSRQDLFVAEGGASREVTQTIERKINTMKFMQVMKSVTLQLQQSNTVSDPIMVATEAGILLLLANLEEALFNGDSSLFSDEFDGIIKQISANSSNVIDLRGSKANTDAFENAIREGAAIAYQNHGNLDSMYMSPAIVQDYQARVSSRTRFIANQGSDTASNAPVILNFPTTFGNIKVYPDKFITESDVHSESTLTGRPGTGTTVVGSVQTSVTGSQFASGDAGTYTYRVAPINSKGEGALVTPTGSFEVAASGSITLTISAVPASATGLVIYRSGVGGSATDARRIATINKAASGNTTYVDINQNLPDTENVVLVTHDASINGDSIIWDQLGSMSKFMLYPTNSVVTPFLIYLYGALDAIAPKKHILLKNVGR